MRMLILILFFGMSFSAYSKDPNKYETGRFIEGMLEKYGYCRFETNRGDGGENLSITSSVFDDANFMTITSLNKNYLKSYGNEIGSVRLLIKQHTTFNLRDVETVEATPLNGNVQILPNFENVPFCQTSVVFQCKLNLETKYDRLECFQEEWGNNSLIASELNLSSKSDWPIHLLHLSADMKTAKKLTKALVHYWKLSGETLIDDSLNEDLFN